jgi:hypothetical protein
MAVTKKAGPKTSDQQSQQIVRDAARLSPGHEHALTEERAMSATVDRYLRALNATNRRGRDASKASLQARVYEARARYKLTNGVEKLLAAREVRDLQVQLAAMSGATETDLEAFEAAFVDIARWFGAMRGIGHGAWVAAGVPATVLKKAGIAGLETGSAIEMPAGPDC